MTTTASGSDITQPNTIPIASSAATIPSGTLPTMPAQATTVLPTSAPAPIQPTFPAQSGQMPSPLTRFIARKARGGWKPVLVLDGGVLMERERRRGGLFGTLLFLVLCLPPTAYAVWLLSDIMLVVIRDQGGFANVSNMAGGLGVSAVFVLFGILGALISLMPMHYWRSPKRTYFDAAKVQAEAQRG